MLRLAPETISRGGAVAVAGLIAIPMAALAGTRRWAAYVLGGVARGARARARPVGLRHLVGRRLGLAGASARDLPADPVRGRRRGEPARAIPPRRLPRRLRRRRAAAARVPRRVLVLPRHRRAALARLARARQARRSGSSPAAIVATRLLRGPPIWTAAVALSLVAPVGLAGLAYLERDDPDRFRLTPGPRARAAHEGARPRTSSSQTSRRATGSRRTRRSTSSAAPPAHVADTKDNYPYERREDVIKFLEQRQRRDPAPLPRGLDRRREAPLRPEARPAEGLLGLALHLYRLSRRS